MEGKTCLVTGGTNGIGKAAATQLAKMGAALVIMGRNPDKGARVVEEIKEACGHDKVSYLQCDMSSLANVREAAASFLQREQPLHVLLNNAGLLNMERRITVDGFEETWAVNHLAPFLFTNLLLEHIKQTPGARIINTASDAYKFVGGIQWDDLSFSQNYKTFSAYGHSKLANILFTQELARKLEGTGVVTHSLHPGAVDTGMGMNNNAPVLKFFARFLRPFFHTPDKGAKTSVYLCSTEDLPQEQGLFWSKCRPQPLKPHATDPQAANKLWQLSLQQTGLL